MIFLYYVIVFFAAASRVALRFLHQLQSLVHAGGRQLPVDVPVAAPQEVAVGGPQVAVEEGVNEGVDEGVCVSEPQQRPLQPQRDAAALHAADKRPRGGNQEERKPAESESADNDSQRGRRLLLALKDGLVFPLSAIPSF